MHDLVIRGGFVVDGTGSPGYTGDLAVDGDMITAVSRDPGVVGAAKREIDADGLVVSPGFVDIHTHYDAQATWDSWLTPSSWHGCTTVVMGNCGVGFAPAAPDRHEWLIELMEGVEDIPGSAMVEGITWAWESFPEYLDAVEARPHVLDIGVMAAHGPVRAYVMGDRGANNEPATDADIARMQTIVRQALEAGALGFSTSRTPIHRSKWGELVPGTLASPDELWGIGDALRAAGHGVFQFAPEHTKAAGEIGWMRELARRTGATVSINLQQTDSAPDLWRDVAAELERARADGLHLVGQVAGRGIGLLLGFDSSVHPFLDHPAWLEVAELPPAARRAALCAPDRRARLITERADDPASLFSLMRANFPKMFPVRSGQVDYEPDPSTSIAVVAAATGASERELVVDALCDGDGTGFLYYPIFNYSYGNLSQLAELHQLEATRMGLSDAGAHCGVICDGGMPTFMLTHWVRDRPDSRPGGRLSLSRVIHRQTGQTAELYGLHDRGTLAPGLRADINLIDLAGLHAGAARVAYDLPAGARRLVQDAKGYVATVCAGIVTVEHDTFTGALPGRLVRGPQGTAGH